MQNRIAGIQMTSGFDLKENLATAKKLIHEAAGEGAKLVILPEMFAIMGDQVDKIKHSEVLDRGPIQDFLHEQAQKNKIWLVGGTLPLVSEKKDKVYATCLTFNEEGKRVARYDKIHLFDVTLNGKSESYSESQTTESGNSIMVIPTPCGKLGVAVCYDLRFPEMFRLMHNEGVEIIAIPAAFTYITGSAHWEILVRARAIENLAYVVAVGQCGAHPNGRKTFGHSMIISPWGEIKASLPQGIGVITADIHLDYLRQLRDEFPALAHRKM